MREWQLPPSLSPALTAPRRPAGEFYEFPSAADPTADCALSLARGAWSDGWVSVPCTASTRTLYATCAADTPARHWRG